MLQRIFLCCLTAIAVIFAATESSLGQAVFRVGAWCFLVDGQPPPIYEQSPNVWRVHTHERDKLLNLGLNYFIACTGLNAEDALVFMGDSLDAAPAPKSFKSTLEIVPPTQPLFPQAYQLWRMSRNAHRFGIQSWNDSVTVGYQAMYNRHSARIDGVHSFLALAEGCTNQLRMMAGINYMCNNTIVDSYVQPWYVPTPFTPQACDSVITYEVAKRLTSADHFMGGGYYLQTGTPTSGPNFQAALQGFVSSLRDPARGIKDASSNTRLWAVLQTQQSTPLNLRLPTKEEILGFVNLSMAQGVKGIVYYVYSTVGSESGLLNTNRDTTAQYNRVKDINTNYQGTGQSLATIGGNFLNLAWKDAFSIHQHTTEPISSTYKLHDVTAQLPGGSNDPANETYVEVGVLQNGSTNHYMLVNRRCTSSETREVTITFQTATNKIYRLTDVYTGGTITYYIGGGSTTFPYTLTLGPGQGKLLKLEDLGTFSGSWSGNVAINTAWVGTITVTTNVSVNNGVSLLVIPSSVIQFASGTSLTVNGKLIADSNDPNQRITFTGTTATPGFWSGLVLNSGSSFLRRTKVASIDLK